jgi:uncharacterized protein (DUF433 family)
MFSILIAARMRLAEFLENWSGNVSTPTTALSEAEADPGLWLAHRVASAVRELDECVERNPARLGGVPVLKGSRISVSQILAELGEGLNADEIGADFDLDASLVRKLVQSLATSLDQAAAA